MVVGKSLILERDLTWKSEFFRYIKDLIKLSREFEKSFK